MIFFNDCYNYNDCPTIVVSFHHHNFSWSKLTFTEKTANKEHASDKLWGMICETKKNQVK